MQFPRFEDALEVTPCDDGKNWIVEHPFYYQTDIELTPDRSIRGYEAYLQRAVVGWKITVPAGFVTDFASIPRMLWNLLPPTGRYARAAVIHDLLYRTKGLATRKQADDVLMEAMTYPCQVGRWTRWTIYLGVRAGGARSYKGGL